MTQADLDRQVAAHTGESLSMVRQMGCVPLKGIPYEREPLLVDWDEVERGRTIVHPRPQNRPLAVA